MGYEAACTRQVKKYSNLIIEICTKYGGGL